MAVSVLAVDDSRTIREMLRMTLREAGSETHLAEDGQHGLEVLSATQPDVIITDINMPRLDGFGFIDAVRSNDRYARIPNFGSDHRKRPRDETARARRGGHRLDRQTLRPRPSLSVHWNW